MTNRTALAALLALLSAPALSPAARAQGAPKQPDTRTTPAPNQTEEVQPPAEPVTPDYPEARWVPASPRNYQVADRPRDRAIDMVVVHDIEGSAPACLSWFQNPQARASSHYVVDSVTGQVYQMVREKDIAWHAGSRDVNGRSVGIEHEGYAYRPGFFNPVEYEAAAKLIRNITERYHIPRDRQHIIAHAEVPNPSKPGQFGGGSGHTDPGPYWDWDALMTLIRNDGRLVRQTIPARIHPGELAEATVVYANTGDDPWVANASGAQDDHVVDSGGAVYLGTANPEGRMSPFFNYKFWTSPRVASSIENGDTAPGKEASFTFSLLGPRRLGTYVESFRLEKVPPMPRGPVAFGEALTATVDVVPWDIVTPAPSATGVDPAWTRKGDIFWRKAGEGAPFAWSVPLTIGGTYSVYARWTPGTSHTRAATYEIMTSDGVVTKTVDQRQGGGWVSLGRYRFDDPKAAAVRLRAGGAPGAVVADAVRFVGPF